MIYPMLALWIISALLILRENNNTRILIYMGIFGLISAICFYILGAPDVAMAEAAISAFTTVFIIVLLERFYGIGGDREEQEDQAKRTKTSPVKYLLPAGFTAAIFFLSVYFMPDNEVNTYLKDFYLARFREDVGGLNPVATILLSYRMYDTLFEALVLVVAVVGVIHMSDFSEIAAKDGKHSEIEGYSMAIFAMRIICPLILIFGVYLILNGHISAGGGFVGGLAIASFFVARFMIYNIYDLPILKVNKMEELVFVAIALLAVAAAFQGLFSYALTPLLKEIYLIVMNALIGLKVACGFIILFYRYVAIERK
ncbi:MAG: DUF4040 domain-containing protein [Treponema sp.]|nr:DUF4040 domain-containing protein [Treponema sp.]